MIQLLMGDFENGWRSYRSRWQSIDHDTPMRAYPQPLWNGKKLPQGRLLLWGEQGIGDEIMFAGLVPDALRTGNSIVLDCEPRLRPLFARSFPEVEVISGYEHDDPGESLSPLICRLAACRRFSGRRKGLLPRARRRISRRMLRSGSVSVPAMPMDGC